MIKETDDKELGMALCICLLEWSKTHFVPTSPRMIELYGKDVLTIEDFGGDKE